MTIPHINTIVHGDALRVMKELPDSSIGLVCTSPPYNLKNSTGNGMKDGRGSRWANASIRDGYTGYDDNMPHDLYVEWQRAILTECMRVLEPTGAVFYNHKWRVQAGLLQDRADIVAGFPVRQIIIWRRAGGINFNEGYFLPTYEVIYLIAGSEFRLADKANLMTDVWDIPQERNNPHPAPMPLALAARIVQSTDANVVLDPFSGSGTTALAAKRAGKDYIGIEQSAEYHEMSIKRLQAETDSLKLF
jgi:modification methylase